MYDADDIHGRLAHHFDVDNADNAYRNGRFQAHTWTWTNYGGAVDHVWVRGPIFNKSGSLSQRSEGEKLTKIDDLDPADAAAIRDTLLRTWSQRIAEVQSRYDALLRTTRTSEEQDRLAERHYEVQNGGI